MQIYLAFLKVGLLSFGGGYTMIPLIEKEIIERGWITATEFIDIIAIAEMAPGTIAANMATFTGFQIAGWFGSIMATLGIITPSLVILLFFGPMLWRLRDNIHIEAILSGLRPAFLALMGMGAFFMADNAIIDFKSGLISVFLFLLLVIRKTNPFSIIIIGALIGILLYPPEP